MAIDGGSVEIRFEGDITPLRRSVEEAVQQVDEFGNTWAKTTDEINKGLNDSESHYKEWGKAGTDAANSVADAFVKVVDNSNSIVSSLGQIGSALKNIGMGAFAVGATAATKSLINMAKGAISETSALENVQIQMIGLTHSVEKGNKAMAMAVKYFKNNPFNRFEVTNATKSLIQFGAKLEEIPTLLDKLGKVALSTGTQIDTIAYYYQRNISDGRIATRDLIQMQNQGIPIFQALAKQMNTTSGAVRELAAKGKVAIEDFQAAFDALVDDKAMERFNETLSRQLDRFKGRMSNMKAALAGYSVSETGGLEIASEGLYRSFTRLVRTFADIMDSETGQKIYQSFEKIGNAIAKVIDKITALLKPAMELFGNFLDFLGSNSELLIPLIGLLTVKITNFASQLPVVGKFLSPIINNFSQLKSGIMSLVTTHPLLSALIGLFTVGFAEAIKTDEEFKQTIKELGQALKDIISTLVQAGKGVFTALVDVVKELASQGVIRGILQGVATALKVIAQAIASIPPETLAGLMSFFLSLKLLNVSPLGYAVALIGMFATYVEQMGGLPQALETIGHNMMTGLFNGLREGATKVIEFVKSVARSVIDVFRNMWGIHSPSTVGYDLGYNWGLGIAGGVADSSNVVQVAMDNLATDVLKIAEKVISNKSSFGLINYKQEYQEWKKVSQLFVEGSEQYNSAIEKMEEARKNANLKILELQKTYNEQLDRTIQKIGSMYGLFSDVNLGGGKNSSQILKGLDQQVAKMQEWAEAQKIINGLGLDPALVEELQDMGVDSVAELSAIANMTADELSTLNDLWLKKQQIANDAGVRQMESLKKDTLEQINELKDGIDGATIDISDVGGRLVESISEGVYGAMPTLESAMAQLGDYIEKARKALGETGQAGVGDEDEDSDLVSGVKQEIEANLDKLKSMLPNIILGAIGAWGAFKFGPKILKAIGNKLFGKGGNVAETLSGTLFKLAEGGKLGKVDLEGVVDALFANSTEGSKSQKIISAIQDKIKGIGSDGTIQEAASNVSKVSKPVESIAQGAQNVSQSVETTGQSMSKASSWMKSIQEGAKTVIYIAGAIAAMAAALWVTYNALKDVDFGKLAIQLTAMGLAVAEFGTLAILADKLKVSVKGILSIAGIAADIALVAIACRLAYEAMAPIDFLKFQLVLVEMAEALVVMGALATAAGLVMEATVGAMALGMLSVIGLAGDIALSGVAIRAAYEAMAPIDFEKFQFVLLEMIEALGVMGGFSTLFGVLAPLVGLGWLSITAICDELVKTSEALYKVYTTVPDDFDNVNGKIDLIKKVLNKIADTDLGTLIGTIVTSWEVGPLTRIIDMYVHVAEQLNKLSKIELDGEAINSNLDYIKTVLETIKAKNDVISGWLEASALDMEASSVENAGRIVIVYGNMVDALNKLANFKPDETAIANSLVAMVNVITKLRSSSYGGGGLFNVFNDMGTVANDVEKIESIVKNYLEMVPTIKSLGEAENKISNSLAKTVEDNIENIKSIVLAIGSVDTGGWIDQKESDVDKIQSILNKFTELIPVVNQISTMNIAKGDANSGAVKRITQVKDLVKEIGSVDTGGWIDQKESDVGKIQSILNKFTELAKTTELLDEYPIADNALQWVKDIRGLVWEIGQINTSQSADMQTKESIIDSATALAQKLAVFSETLKSIKNPVQQDIATGLVSTVNTLVEGLSTNLTDKVAVFQNIGVQIGEKLSSGIRSQSISLTQAGIGMQSAVWSGVQSKLNDEYYQGRTLGEKFRQGIYDIDYANSGWWAVQGFVNGVYNRGYYSGGDSVYWVGYNVANTFLNGLKARAGEGSPWKTTFQSGDWAIQGLIEGVKNSEDDLIMEAESLADKLVDTLSIDNIQVSPELSVANGLAPNMATSEYGMMGSTAGVVINQTNTNYTEYDIEQTSRDLAWQLAKI